MTTVAPSDLPPGGEVKALLLKNLKGHQLVLNVSQSAAESVYVTWEVVSSQELTTVPANGAPPSVGLLGAVPVAPGVPRGPDAVCVDLKLLCAREESTSRCTPSDGGFSGEATLSVLAGENYELQCDVKYFYLNSEKQLEERTQQVESLSTGIVFRALKDSSQGPDKGQSLGSGSIAAIAVAAVLGAAVLVAAGHVYRKRKARLRASDTERLVQFQPHFRPFFPDRQGQDLASESATVNIRL